MTPDDPEMTGMYMAWYHIGAIEQHLDRVPEPDWHDMNDTDRALARTAYFAGRNGRPVTFASAIERTTPDVIDVPREASKPIINLDEKRRARKPKTKKTP